MKAKVFYELEKVQSKKQRDYEAGKVSEPIDNLGDRVEEEYKKRSLQEDEKELSFDYFIGDFEDSLNAAYRYLGPLENTRPDTDGFKCLVSKTRQFLRRAITSEKRCRKICDESIASALDRDDDSLKAELNDFKTRLYFIQEFPQIFLDMMELDKQQNDAIKKEQYNLADHLNRKIKRIISEEGGDYPNNLDLEYAGNAD